MKKRVPKSVHHVLLPAVRGKALPRPVAHAAPDRRSCRRRRRLHPGPNRFPAYGYPNADASVDELWESEGLAARYGNR